eukprot:CAMPEP_0196651552 /NCGR_PEP_ID=MMETSP1086-20130531/553_1 /TAXON_ID=77921 /ORGANISM="Cyanoptyche  gloeocystis , Strain SAG4.97" /LENGTH=1020 /DNA_ID=CAMNT_0041981617 /DNA_START=83 /DNA_END=3145 /DNA_ORIENTATION=-
MSAFVPSAGALVARVVGSSVVPLSSLTCNKSPIRVQNDLVRRTFLCGGPSTFMGRRAELRPVAAVFESNVPVLVRSEAADGAVTLEAPKIKQSVYAFGPGAPKAPVDRNLLGGKGNNLCEMANFGIPVPPGFVITTESCNNYRAEGRQLKDSLRDEIRSAVKFLESQMGLKLGSAENPLLVSVRSGARVSMPGMMDTVLNLGCNDKSVVGLAKSTNNDRMAYDSYRRFIMMYGDVVKNVEKKLFERAFDALKEAEGVTSDVDLSVDGLKKACDVFKKIYKDSLGQDFPQDPEEQLFGAVRAVFNSWDSERAQVYRRVNDIPDDWGTAVVVQTMVFGNKGDTSATGVGFTRNPISGENTFYGEFLINAQGEDVVAGIRTPQPVNKLQAAKDGIDLPTLEELMPEVYQQLVDTGKLLEKNYGDMQDMEFTIENGKLYMLQTRNGKRTGFAAVRVAGEMLREGLMTEKGAIRSIQPDQLTQLLAPIFDQKAKDKAKDKLVAKGINAGPGAATGLAVMSSAKAVLWAQEGKKVVLVTEETSPDDYPGMVAAEGILTARGGSTSHAAVVARGMGKPCVVGCSDLHIDEEKLTISAKGMTIKEGDAIAVDGTTGEVFFTDVTTSPSEVVQVLINKTKKEEDSALFQNYKVLMELADKYRTMTVRANADTPVDAAVGRAFGCEGIGLCRTEHMFFEEQRLTDVRRMFFSKDNNARVSAIARLKKYQKSDFVGIFEALDGLPVNIRLLDPPLHEFIPHTDEELAALVPVLEMTLDELKAMRSDLEECNPMLGHRGCRLGIVYPELTEMQVSAILEAALEVQAKGLTVIPEIMVPLVTTEKELQHQKSLIMKTAKKVFEEAGKSIKFAVGTMVEQPRAALCADALAKHAEYFSFGTNDLTQTTFGISRDDAGKFVPLYIEGIPNPEHPNELMVILQADPFQKLDQEGVGQLMEIAVTKGRSVNPNLKCGICGEHGGDPSSVKFVQSIGLNYASCSPYRVPLARLAAAQAALDNPRKLSDAALPGAKSWM